ncbi:Neutral/alkaline non-lysosomal ceramidase, N-terminal [Granulicella pectinivorans]|uniref:Neutral/alkaline non-lysosomal ceramidase, N-terminal n=1 Tax=Granulicella pectinivorans TaxID=474950 RepID=A0A1I6L566_9BACT|nr:neutral/alkaline non-lysosomal ceramidase N-terminal domain-containing protein [Granulicella pectinivorans]SFR98574.1 Neutral/alkaline non-lysosomal ceramidase, N-terminal [Granulicella pectinivorans]
MADWRIGFARQRITPPLGCEMAGFDARMGVANAVHDDLHAHALIFDDGGTQAALISIDVIAVSAEFSLAVRRDIESSTGIPAGNVFLAATHTHCGPVTINGFFNQGQFLDPAYLLSLHEHVVSAVVRASESRKPRVLKTGMAPVEGIAVNRRTPDGLPVDPYAGVLAIEETDGTIAAIAVIYACHTTVLGPNTLSLTQDFPFYTLAKLKSELGDDVETLYFNGAQGDLSIGHKSNLSAVGIIDPFRTFATAQRLGERLADAVLAGLPTLTPEASRVQVLSKNVALPLKQYEPLAVMTAAREKAGRAIVADRMDAEMLAIRQQSLYARIEEYHARLYEESEAPEPKTLTVEFAAVLLGETAFITLPGEIFIRVALAIRAASPFAKTLFLGLTNNYIGYLPDHEATRDSGYEVVASRVPAIAGDILQSEAASMLHALKEAL